MLTMITGRCDGLAQRLCGTAAWQRVDLSRQPGGVRGCWQRIPAAWQRMRISLSLAARVCLYL